MTAPGTYTGADGREYHWKRVRTADNTEAFNTYAENGFGVLMAAADWPAAKAALDALVEAESGEWVLLPAPNQEEPYIRISLDGQRVQERSQEGRWNDYDAWWIKAAYRKGREVALEEVREVEWMLGSLQSKAQLLVDVIEEKAPLAVLRDESPDGSPVWDWVVRIFDAAKALEGKL